MINLVCSLCFFFSMSALISFEPPEKPRPTQGAGLHLTQQERPPVKKVQINPLMEIVYIGSSSQIQSLINQGITITPTDLYQLINVQTGAHALANIYFWFNHGLFFLLFATVRAPRAMGESAVKPLKELAADAIFKDSNAQRRERALKSSEFGRFALLKDLRAIKSEINKIFEKVNKAQEGQLSTQKLSIRKEMQAKAEQHLSDLWLDILNTQPNGFSAAVLEYLVEWISQNAHLLSNPKLLLQGYIDSWVKLRCQELLKITSYIRTRRLLQPILEQVKEAYFRFYDAALVQRPQMQPYEDLKSLLSVTPSTCPAVVKLLLLKRLGQKAVSILEGKLNGNQMI